MMHIEEPRQLVEVVGARKKGCARRRYARARPLLPQLL